MTEASLLTKLSRGFYERECLTVCKEILGKILIRVEATHLLAGRIVEVEAYVGPNDRASHAFGNKLTDRTKVQFADRGHAYIYRIYGIHWCFCIVIGPKCIPAVCLVRAVQPLDGLEFMRVRVNAETNLKIANGPGKLCKAFAIDGAFYGEDLCGERLFLTYDANPLSHDIQSSRRIGVEYAKESNSLPWRFFIRGNAFVSRNRGSVNGF